MKSNKSPRWRFFDRINKMKYSKKPIDNNLEKYYKKWISAIANDETGRTIKRHIIRHAKEIYSKESKVWSASMRNLIEVFDEVYKSTPSIKLKIKRLQHKYKLNPKRYTPPPSK
ncbi:MAG: hypothetical protein ACKKMS_03395 [Candidatus Nealsonbacteria bacterium]